MAIQANHRASHTPIYIFPPPYEDAWDRARIDTELDLIDAWEAYAKSLAKGEAPTEPDALSPWSSREDHPVVRFRSGEARFDVETIRDYLLPGKKPTYVVLRRMAIGQWQELQSYLEREVNQVEPVLGLDGQPTKDEEGKPVTRITAVLGRTSTLLCAIRFAVAEITDFGVKAAKTGMTDAQLEQLREHLDDEQFQLLGYACLASSRSLSAVESFR